MAESLFGSGPQLWSAIPAPGFAYASAPGSGVQSVPNGPPAPSMAPAAGNWPPGLTAYDIATGVTPQALLAAVAFRRGQPMGPTGDQEIEDFISDALDLMAGANDVEVRCEGGRATLTGSVAHKRLKRDAGEVVWAMPNVNDVQNNITIAARRRSRASGRETEHAAAGGNRKQG